MSSTAAQYHDPPNKWSAHLVDDVDWVAQVWDWRTADRLTGQLLSFVVPLEDWIGCQPVKGSVLIAGRRQPDGADQTVLLIAKEELSPDRLSAARPLAHDSPSAPGPKGSPEVYLLRDLAVVGTTGLLKPEAADVRTHPLGDALQEFPPETLVALAVRPSLVDSTSLPAALQFLMKSSLVAVAIENWPQRISLSLLVPMLAAEAEARAKQVRTAAKEYREGVISRAAGNAHRLDAGAMALTSLAARLSVWPRCSTENNKFEALRGRVDFSSGELPHLLADLLSFPNSQEVLDAHAYGHKNGYWTLYLATLSPAFRLAAMREGLLKETELAQPELEVFYHFEPLWESEQNAGYRLRIRENKTNVVLQDLRVDLVQRNGRWMIDWLGPYGSSRVAELRVEDAAEPPHQWRVLSADDGAEVAVVQGKWVSQPLPGGKYLVALQRFVDEGREVLFPRPTEHGAGTPMRLAIQTAVEIRTDGRLGTLFRWEVVRAHEPETVVQWHTGKHTVMLVSSGIYKVAIKPSQFEGERILWPAELDLIKDGYALVQLASGIILDVAEWMPPRDPNYGWWGVVHAGEPTDRRINWTNSADALLLPPGKYDVYWVQDYDHRVSPLLIAGAVQVKENALATLHAKSGLKLKLPRDTPALDENWGWWGVVPVSGKADAPIHWVKGRFDQPLLVLPGSYDVVWKKDYSHQPEKIKQGVVVSGNALLEVEVEVRYPGAG